MTHWMTLNLLITHLCKWLGWCKKDNEK